MYSDDLHWRIVSLVHIYDIEVHLLSDIFCPKLRSIQRQYKIFLKTGTVWNNLLVSRGSRWPHEVIIDVEKYVKVHPTFYLQELEDYVRSQFPNLKHTSESTICRVLNFDLQLSRKKLTKAAREAAPEEIHNFYDKLKPIYSFPEQLVFIDETSKDVRDAFC